MVGPQNDQPISMERHLAVAEVAKLWGFSVEKTRLLFKDEPGVLIIESHGHGKRPYHSMRIPASVLERVHRRLTQRPVPDDKQRLSAAQKELPVQKRGTRRGSVLPMSVLGGREHTGDAPPALDGGDEQKRSHEDCAVLGKCS